MTAQPWYSHVVIVLAVLAALVVCGVEKVFAGTDVFAGIIGVATAAGVYVGVTAGAAAVTNAAATGAATAIQEITKAARSAP